jgi:hypothetical protein
VIFRLIEECRSGFRSQPPPSVVTGHSPDSGAGAGYRLAFGPAAQPGSAITDALGSKSRGLPSLAAPELGGFLHQWRTSAVVHLSHLIPSPVKLVGAAPEAGPRHRDLGHLESNVPAGIVRKTAYSIGAGSA